MRLKKGVLIQKMGKSFVAYDNETSTLHELNETGYVIIEEIGKGKTVSQIADKIIRKYDISKKEARGEIDDYRNLLRKKDLIVGK